MATKKESGGMTDNGDNGPVASAGGTFGPSGAAGAQRLQDQVNRKAKFESGLYIFGTQASGRPDRVTMPKSAKGPRASRIATPMTITDKSASEDNTALTRRKIVSPLGNISRRTRG